MNGKVTLVVPEAPPPAGAPVARQRKLGHGGLRLGILDNTKGNADHLLDFVIEGLRPLIPIASVVSVRKGNVAQAAEASLIERLVAEADFVITAMAD